MIEEQVYHTREALERRRELLEADLAVVLTAYYAAPHREACLVGELDHVEGLLAETVDDQLALAA